MPSDAQAGQAGVGQTDIEGAEQVVVEQPAVKQPGAEQTTVEHPGVEQLEVVQHFFEQPPDDLSLFKQLLLEQKGVNLPGVGPLEAALGAPASAVKQPRTGEPEVVQVGAESPPSDLSQDEQLLWVPPLAQPGVQRPGVGALKVALGARTPVVEQPVFE